MSPMLGFCDIQPGDPAANYSTAIYLPHNGKLTLECEEAFDGVQNSDGRVMNSIFSDYVQLYAATFQTIPWANNYRIIALGYVKSRGLINKNTFVPKSSLLFMKL